MMRCCRAGFVVLVASLFTVISGCGGGGSSASGSTGGNATAAPQITLSPSALSFSNTTVGQTSASQSVTVANTGNAALVFAAVPTLSDTTNYTLTNGCSTTLTAGASCTLGVTFHPANSGAIGASITLMDNSANATNAQQTVALSGTGTGTAAGVPAVTLSPTTLEFSNTTAAGARSAVMSMRITNSGNATLAASGAFVSGSSYFQSNGETCSRGTLAALPAAAYCTESFTFTPAAAGTSYTGTFVFTDNAGGIAGSTQTLNLTGTGAAALTTAAATLTTSITFPSTQVGTTASAMTATLTNTGPVALTGISEAITGGVTATAFTVSATTCGTTLAVGASCTFSITFSPTAMGNYLAYLTVTDNAGTQTTMLNGPAVAPVLALSVTSIAFPATTVGTTTSASTATLSNTGGVTANLSSIVYSGATTFTETNTCGTTLAAGASCTISVTYKPADTTTTTGAVTITSSNATPSPLTLSLSGTGSNATVSYQLYVLPDPGVGQPGGGTMAALYALVNNAQTSIDMTMYEMQDTTFLNDLVAACGRGVKVRVIFSSSIASSSATSYSTLNATTNCSAVNSNTAFTNTHQKSFLVDGATIALMSLNLQSKYYATTRDYALIYNDPVDYAAIEATFNADYAAGGTNSSTDFNFPAPTGSDLIWSPTTSATEMVNIINNATTTLSIENEEFSSSTIYNAIGDACKRGVSVRITIENESNEYATGLTAIKTVGCAPHQFTSGAATAFYVHGKAVVADYGLPTQKAYMGSINYSNASLNKNRELGIYLPDQASITLLYNTINADYTNGAIY